MRGMVGAQHRLNVYYFDYRTDLTDSLCGAWSASTCRQAMTKAQIDKVMSVVKKPRIEVVHYISVTEMKSFPQMT